MVWTERTEMLIGENGLRKLADARVSVVGVGGVGAYAAEMLVRAGLGHIVLFDCDEVGESNINRQLVALHSTVGRLKTDVLRNRLMDINPQLDIVVVGEYVNEDYLRDGCPLDGSDVVIDAIDTLSPKVALIQHCLSKGIHLVSSMGSGAKLDATAVRLADISETFQCPLAHMLRKRLHRLGITEGFDAVFSAEKPRKDSMRLEESRNKKSQVGTISYIPAVFGCVCAQAAVRYITGIC